MLPLVIFDYEKQQEFCIEITKFANRNIGEVIRVLIDYINEDPNFGIEPFFTRDYLEQKPEQCRKSIFELYEIVQSSLVRDYIKPNYEYLLYNILQWWIDSTDADQELLIISLDEELKNKITSSENYTEEEKSYILNAIIDFEEYENLLFEDIDFLPEEANKMVIQYLKNPKLVEMFYFYEDLDDFMDLMDCDLRKRYIEFEVQRKQSRNINIEKEIILEILNALKLFQKRIIHFEKYGEVEITAQLNDNLSSILNYKYNLQIAREYTMGRAIKTLGETDLYIFNQQDGRVEDYTIVENKYIEHFVDQYYQLMGYLNQNFHFGITLSINKNMPLTEAYKFINDKLLGLKGDKFEAKKISQLSAGNDTVIISEHVIPENGHWMRVYHLIFNLYDADRLDAAKKARKNRKKNQISL